MESCLFRGTSRPHDIFVTSACIDGNTDKSMAIKYDGVDRLDLVQSGEVTRIIVHPSYNAGTLANNIGVLKLSAPVTESATVKFIKLARELEWFPSVGVVVGWGKLKPNATSMPINLHYINTSVIGGPQCVDPLRVSGISFYPR